MLFEKIKLEKDEQMLLVVRRHWFVFLMKLLSVCVTAIAPLVLLFGLMLHNVTEPYITAAFQDYGREIWFLISLWLLFHWMVFAYLWTDQYLDLWVITDRRIIAIDQQRLFVRNIGSFRLERLQDLNIEIPGFLATILDYGNVEAQTASGSEEEFSARSLPKPREVKSLILEAADLRLRSMTNSGI